MNEQQQPFSSSAPLAELVQRLTKGKSLAELVRVARFRRKRPGSEQPQSTSVQPKPVGKRI